MNVSSYDPVQPVYDQLWTEAITCFGRGEVQTDPYLSPQTNDNRRGLTLIARPSSGVVSQFSKFVKQIEFVTNDWYMSRDRVNEMATYSLNHRVRQA